MRTISGVTVKMFLGKFRPKVQVSVLSCLLWICRSALHVSMKSSSMASTARSTASGAVMEGLHWCQTQSWHVQRDGAEHMATCLAHELGGNGNKRLRQEAHSHPQMQARSIWRPEPKKLQEYSAITQKRLFILVVTQKAKDAILTLFPINEILQAKQTCSPMDTFTLLDPSLVGIYARLARTTLHNRKIKQTYIYIYMGMNAL